MKVITLYLIAAVLLISCATASRIWHPATSLPFETPVLTNGIVGGTPSKFNLTASVVYPNAPCSSFNADGKIVILKYTGSCPIALKIENTLKSGAIAIMVDMDETKQLGRYANIPLTSVPIKIPIVSFGSGGRIALDSFGVFNPQPVPNHPPTQPRNPNGDPNDPDKHRRSVAQQQPQPNVVLQLVPGRNEWADTVFNQPWWLAVQAIFCGGFFSLLVLIVFKFVKKLKLEDRYHNISLACLVFLAVFCIFLLIRWLDPLLTRGIFARDSELMLSLLPSSLSLIGFGLIGFYWLKLLIHFDGSKFTLILNDKGFKIAFWILSGSVVVVTVAAIIVNRLQPLIKLVFAVEIMQLVMNLFIAVLYLAITIRWAITNKKEKKNLDNKIQFVVIFSRRVFASFIISTVIMTIEPIARFVLMRFMQTNNYFHVAIIMTESFLFAVLVLFQVLFMPVNPFMNKKIEDEANAHDMNSMSAGTSSEKSDSLRSSQEHV